MARPTGSAAAGRKRRTAPDPEDDDEDTQQSPEPATQRRRLSADDEDEVVIENGEDDGAYGGDNGNGNDASLDQMVKKLVRLALACEYQRKPIRRAEISEKVLAGGQGGRKFKEVFIRAQAELKGVFGMEMVELPAREKVTIAQKRAAAAKQSQSAKPSTSSTSQSTSWILTSILPSQFRIPEIIAPPAAPTSEQDSAYTALYSTLISLISLSGNDLPDAKLERFLRRLNVADNVPLNGGKETSEKMLKRMEKEGYLVRVRNTGTAADEEDISWTVGPRGKVEVGDHGVRGMIRAVYAPVEGTEGDELERKVARSLGLGEKRKKAEDAAQAQANGEPSRNRTRRATADDDENDDDGE